VSLMGAYGRSRFIPFGLNGAAAEVV
jgi:hypothetical protein